MIYLFLAGGFEEIEAVAPLDILRRAELAVTTVGVGGKTVVGAHGIEVTADIEAHQASPENAEMIILPGGMPGTLNLEKSEIVQCFIDLCAQNNKWIGAICAAPSILGHKGLLDGRQFTCYPGFESQVAGGKYQAGGVVRDGRFITAAGPGVAIPFGLALVDVLLGKERAGKVRLALQCENSI
ncbi:MAG: DJ-1 family glyoxalase III [Acetanaerobacterium sp.]